MHRNALRLCSALHNLVLGTTLCALSTGIANAGPQGGVVAGGDATITANGNSTLIQQGTNRAAIDWRSFDIKPSESVVFQQPSSSSITLNRIHDQKPSEIFGSVIANGQIILSNPSGMIFGKGSRVDVAGLVATTASIGTDAFMNDATLNFSDSGMHNGKIINEGTITAKNAGLITLVAPQVENNGFIGARLGKIELAGADTFTVDFYGDGLINLAVDEATLKTAVINSGTLRAKAGAIALTAAQAKHLLSSTVNIGGVVDVTASRVDANGTIVFDDGIGGDIQASACTVNVETDAELDARGPNGGGSVKLGGDWQGKELTLGQHALANAQTINVKKGAAIRATAINKGNGGTVVLWSEDATRFDGVIRARGGKNGGNGGNIETSSKGVLGIAGDADASAKAGMGGNWLLDPRNVTISGAGAYSVNPGGETVDPGSDNFTILASSISTALTNGNNVSITTGTTGGQTGDITLDNATIAKTGGGTATLTLKAEGSILTNGTNSITSNTGALNVIFWADAEAVPNSDGYISLTNTTITTNGGDVILGGGLDNGANGGVAADGRPDNYAWGNAALDDGVTLNNTDITAAGGSFKILGHGRNNAGSSDQAGIKINNGSLLQTNGSGSFTITGVAGAGTDDNRGIHIADAGTELDVVNGAITLTGTGAGSGQNNFGIEFHNGAKINSTGTGAGIGTVTFDGTASATATGQMNIGTMIRNPNTLITAVDGDISITGRGNNSAGIKGSGIWVHNQAHVETTGVGANAGDITLTGYGLNGDEQHGLLFKTTVGFIRLKEIY
ncbi:MAG: filamentous hemagglutinin N-terminal domain-containing protein [Rickettsiales bacterium]